VVVKGVKGAAAQAKASYFLQVSRGFFLSFRYCTEIVVGLVLSVGPQMGVELGSYELINFATVVVTSLSNFQNPFSMPSRLQTVVSLTEKYFDL